MSSATDISSLINSISSAADTTSSNFTDAVMWGTEQSQRQLENERQRHLDRRAAEQWNIEKLMAQLAMREQMEQGNWRRQLMNALGRGVGSQPAGVVMQPASAQ